MSLSQLPTEILWIISSHLSHQSDIYALVRTNCRLYQELAKCLYYWNAQFDHGSALFVTAKNNLLAQLKHVLVGLDLARTKSHSFPQQETQVSQVPPRITHDNSSYYLCKRYIDVKEEEEGKIFEREDKKRRSDPYWEDIYTHRLSSEGYCFMSIINIQHALAAGIQAGHTEVVQALLDFGAEVNFYRGSRTANPLPKYSSISRYTELVEIDNPPLFIAVQYGQIEILSKLLKSGADPQRYTPSPLYRAVEDDHRAIVSFLLEKDSRSQKSALKLAALRENYAMVEFLLCNGLKASEHGNVGLYVAEMKGYKKMASLLKLHGATIDTLSDSDRENWETEDRDGTDRPKYVVRCSNPHVEDYPDDTEPSESESEI